MKFNSFFSGINPKSSAKKESPSFGGLLGKPSPGGLSNVSRPSLGKIWLLLMSEHISRWTLLVIYAYFECGSLWVWCQLNQKTVNMVYDTSPMKTEHYADSSLNTNFFFSALEIIFSWKLQFAINKGKQTSKIIILFDLKRGRGRLYSSANNERVIKIWFHSLDVS